MGQKQCCAAEVRAAEARSEADGDEPQMPPPDETTKSAEELAPETVAVEVPRVAAEQDTTHVIDLNHPPVDVAAPFDKRDQALVQHTWAKAAQGGAEHVGTMLFEKIFELAPTVKALFPFSFDRGSGRSDMLRHVTKVVETLGIAVSGLNDLDALKPMLQALGLRHVGYKVMPEHYDVVCDALHQTLAAALQDDATPSVRASWEKAFCFVRKSMIGDHYAVRSPAAVPAEDNEKEAVVALKPEEAESVEVPALKFDIVKPQEELTAPASAAETASAPATPVPLPPATEPPPTDTNAPKIARDSKSGRPSRTGSRPPGKGKDKDKIKEHKAHKDHKGKDRKDQAEPSRLKGQGHRVTRTGHKAEASPSPSGSPSASPASSPRASPGSSPSASPETKSRKMSSKRRKAFWRALSDEERAAQSSALVEASKNGNLEEVKRLYEAGVDVNVDDPNGRSALRFAAKIGAFDIVEYLVKTANANINAARPGARGKETSLHLACSFGKLDVVVFLVQNGADVTMKNTQAKSPADLMKNEALAAWLSGPNPKDAPPPSF